MSNYLKIPTDNLTFKIVESACDHLTVLCGEATRLTAEMKPKSTRLEFIPGLVVALASGGMEVSTAVVCVFKKGHPHELQHLWTESTMNERLQRMKAVYSDFIACNRNPDQLAQLLTTHSSKDPWLNVQPSELQDALNVKTGRSSPVASPASSALRRVSATSAASTTAIRELRNENSKLFAELQLLREHRPPTLKPTDDYPAAEVLSLRRRLQAIERRASADRARIEAKTAEIAEKEAHLASREISLAKQEWMRSLDVKRQPAKIPPPSSARTETAAPQRESRRWR